ncbi:hypothetical protein [Maridesulfovibrio frigidus]|uniref:hypothetical protein n=1 Tax=Maridesulfovibrio frigidus TaxID=340956 RepID=UPI000555351A|nr:hypothetical protein [Maridesulfovibrio frigidus]
MKKIVLLIMLLGMTATCAFANGPQNRQGPPQEAYTACEGKQAGDSAEFTSPHGDTVSGTCEEDGDNLVLRPTNAPQGNRENSQQ